MRRLGPTILGLSLGALLVGCGSGETEISEEAFAEESWREDGPLELHMTIDRTEIDAVGSARVWFETVIDPEYTLIEPEISETLGEFTVIEAERRGPSMGEDGRVRWSLALVLEPYLPGEYEIPAMAFAYAPVGEAGGDERVGGEILTRPIAIRVLSVLDSEQLTLGELRGVVDPESAFELPTGGILIGAVVGGGLLLAIILIGRRLRMEPQTPSPVAEAMQRLQVLATLPHESLVERQATLAEVYMLVLVCISHRAEPGAAGMSERELRRSMAHWPGLDAHEQIALGGFLKHLDEAQFAGSEPDRKTADRLVREAVELVPVIERAGAHFSIAASANNGYEEALSAS